MRRSIPAFAAIALSALAPAAGAQQAVPVVTLPEPTAKAAQSFGVILDLRALSDGRVLVDDAGHRQIRLFGPDLQSSTIVLDSAAGTSRSYGARPTPLIPYLADSTLVPDYQSRTISVFDAQGHLVRSWAMPTVGDVGLLRRGASVDRAGRLVYVGNADLVPLPNARPGDQPALSDSTPLLRADLEARRTDTIAMIARPVDLIQAMSPDTKTLLKVYTPNPMGTMDEWAVLTDGSVAIVRGHDYHVDWIRPDGSVASTAKLPFAWRQLSDVDKQRIVDSTRAQLDAEIQDGSIIQQAERVEIIRHGGGGGPAMPGTSRPSVERSGRGGGAGGSGPSFFGFTLLPRDSTTVDQVADYYPPLRMGAVLADLDDHLWILPTTSKESLHGELVYDVVDAQGKLIERVRIPPGRLIVGFGPDRAIYLMSGSRTTGFSLERSVLPKGT